MLTDYPTVVITGASSGIGKEACEHFLRLGVKVIGMARRSAGILDENFLELECDIADDNSVISAVRKINGNLPIGALINCAGITKPMDVLPDIDTFKETFDVNLFGSYRMIINLLPFLEQCDGSSIINIASIGGMLGFPNNPSYGASKAALINLTQNLAIDLGDKGIRVNSVSPGYFRTDMTRSSYENSDARELRENQTILKRYGETHELMGMLEFLVSNKSSYITGQNFTVDGGWTSKGLKV